jgi:YVTN family beta-propeller protein
MLGDVAGLAAAALIVTGLREWRAARRALAWSVLLAGFFAVAMAFQQPASVPVLLLDGAVIAAGGWLIVTEGRRTRRRRLAARAADQRRIASVPGIGKNPQSVALSPDGRMAYVPAPERGTLAVVDIEARSVLALIRAGRGATDALALPDSHRVLVSRVRGRRRGTLAVVDVPGRQVVCTIAGIRQPRTMALSPDGSVAYVPSMCDDKVWRLDAVTLEITGEGDAGRRPTAVTASPDGQRLYVAAFWSGAVLVLDAGSLSTISRIPVAAAPRRLAVTADSRHVYAACSDGVLVVLDTATNALVARSRPGTCEGGVAAGPAASLACYLTDPLEGEVITLAGPVARERVHCGDKAPIDVAVRSDGLLCVACQSGVLELIRDEM